MSILSPSINTIQTLVQSSFDALYHTCEYGKLGFSSASKLAYDYLFRYGSRDEAVTKLIEQESIKAASSGFLTNLGGIITLPLTLPLNVSGLILIQLRLVMTIALLYELTIPVKQSKALYLFLLTGHAGKQLCQQYVHGVLLGSSKSLTKQINHCIGLSLIKQQAVKTTTKLFRFMPFIGGIISGTMDGLLTYRMGISAKGHILSLLRTKLS